MGDVRKLPEPVDGQGRVESGALQVGDDWPGLFLRGDECFALSQHIAAFLEGRETFLDRGYLHDLRNLIEHRVRVRTRRGPGGTEQQPRSGAGKLESG